MTQAVHVHFLPAYVEPESLRGGVAVVIDVLRASTTIVHALAAGAERVIPCETVDEARAVAANLPAGTAVLGGERGGVRIDGFQLGNSPLEYTPETVEGKSVVFTTTNGTRALARCREAERILVGAIVNCRAASLAAARDDRPVHLVCAGTDGWVSAEDVLCAGAMADQLAEYKGGESVLDDAASIAWNFASIGSGNRVSTVLRASRGGRNLIELGYDRDIVQSGQIDIFQVVPEYDVHRNELRVAFRP